MVNCPDHFNCPANNCRINCPQIHEAHKVQAFMDPPFIIVCPDGSTEDNSAN